MPGTCVTGNLVGESFVGNCVTSWNANRLIRQFFPKGLDLGRVRRQDLRRVERLLNTWPRKTLGYRTPLEMLSEPWSP